jgi:hypothetical protein
MSANLAERPASVGLRQEKLLGFRHIAAFTADPRALCQALDATHNKETRNFAL